MAATNLQRDVEGGLGLSEAGWDVDAVDVAVVALAAAAAAGHADVVVVAVDVVVGWRVVAKEVEELSLPVHSSCAGGADDFT